MEVGKQNQNYSIGSNLPGRVQFLLGANLNLDSRFLQSLKNRFIL